MRAEATLLRGAGHDVVVDEHANPDGIAAAPAFARAPWSRGAARDAVARVRAVAPDVVHVHNTWFALTPAIVPAIRATGVPVLATLHNYRLFCLDHTLFRDGAVCTDCVGRSPWPGVQHRCYGNSLPRSVIAGATIAVARRRHAWDAVDRFLAPSETVKRWHVAAGIAPERIVVKPHFTADPGPRTRAPSASQEVLLPARLAPGKGVVHAVEAWNRAAPAGLTLHVLGDGPDRPAVERAAGPAVVVEGHRPPDEVAARLRAARALLFPSEWLEPFGLVLIEAMAAGLPVVGSAVADAPAIVGDGGELAAPDDLHTTFAALADAGRADEMGRAGRARWEAVYSPGVALGALEAVYRSALDAAGGRQGDV